MNMLLKLSIIFIVLFIRRLDTIAHVHDSSTHSLTRLGNKTIEIQMSEDDHSCQCQFVASPEANYGDEYIYTPGIGAHKFHNLAKTWNEARKTCMEEGAHLAILNSKREEEVLHAVFTKEFATIKNEKLVATGKDVAWLGVHNLFHSSDWVTVLGDSLNSVGFVGWYKRTDCWGIQPDNWNGTQHCVALIRPCGMTDDVDCDWPLAFFCEKPEIIPNYIN